MAIVKHIWLIAFDRVHSHSSTVYFDTDLTGEKSFTEPLEGAKVKILIKTKKTKKS